MGVRLSKQNKDCKLFSLKGKCYRCKIVDVYDGDTVTGVIYLHMKYQKFKIRMLGYDSPEMKPPLNQENRLEEKRQALIARNALANKIMNRIVKLECGHWDKYGRLLGVIYTSGLCGKMNVNQWMLDNSYGYPYDGGKKQSFKS
uniref:TNase-like domain-containing protein n=1 Tax=Megaviridae environmental sample TaxID=1737588 RepID=A0A5J6VIU2_9VIRU|nr:MAG: hypothetical protein [Megaviridae environmental sample]